MSGRNLIAQALARTSAGPSRFQGRGGAASRQRLAGTVRTADDLGTCAWARRRGPECRYRSVTPPLRKITSLTGAPGRVHMTAVSFLMIRWGVATLPRV